MTEDIPLRLLRLFPWVNLLFMAGLLFLANWLLKRFPHLSDPIARIAGPSPPTEGQTQEALDAYGKQRSLIVGGIIYAILLIVWAILTTSLVLHLGIPFSRLDRIQSVWWISIPPVLAALLSLIFVLSFRFAAKLEEYAIGLAFVSFFAGILIMLIAWLAPILLPQIEADMATEEKNALAVIIGLLLAIVGPVGGLAASIAYRSGVLRRSVEAAIAETRRSAAFVQFLDDIKPERIKTLALNTARAVAVISERYRSTRHRAVVDQYLDVCYRVFEGDIARIKSTGSIVQRDPAFIDIIYDHMFDNTNSSLRMTSFVSFTGANFWNQLDETGGLRAAAYLARQSSRLSRLRTRLPGTEFKRLVIVRTGDLGDAARTRQELSTLSNLHRIYGRGISLRFISEAYARQLLGGGEPNDLGIVDDDLLLVNTLDAGHRVVTGYAIYFQPTGVEQRIHEFEEMWIHATTDPNAAC